MIDRAFAVPTAISMSIATYMALVYAPTERVEGNVQRIFYFHVSMAWTAYLAFFVVFIASVVVLWKRLPQADRLAQASAEVGLLFTTLVLITGSLWARPIWGTWWSWDARLTTTLFLWFIYLGYLMVRTSIPDDRRAIRFAAAIGIVGFIDVPIIHQSVVWWRTLHPESIVGASGGPAMPSEMLLTLGVTLVAFTLLYVGLVRLRMGIETARAELRQARVALAEGTA